MVANAATICGTHKAEEFHASDGDTHIEAYGGDDVISTGIGSDYVDGGAGNDVADTDGGNYTCVDVEASTHCEAVS